MTAALPRIGERASWQRAVLEWLEPAGYVTRHRGEDHAEFRCPAHEDHRASGTADYRPGNPGRTLLHCHGGCSVEDIMAAGPLVLADLFDGPAPRDARPAAPRPRRAPERPRPAPAEPACRHHYVPDPDYPEHPYVTAEGVLVARVLRKRCDRCSQKRIQPERAGWDEADRVLYRLPEVLAAAGAGQTVYVVEGEKSADALAALGHAATTNPFGAGKWLAQHTAALAAAARVVVIADNDRDGYAHAAHVAGQLAAAGVPDVTTVRAAADIPKVDVVDHLAAGGTVETLLPVDPRARLAELEHADDRGGQVADLTARRGGGGRGGRRPPDDDEGLDDEGGEPDPPSGAELVEGSPGWAHLPPDGDFPGAVMQLAGSGKARRWTHVLSWSPGMQARLVTEADDGRATGRHFEVCVGEDTQIVSHADLRTGEAWDMFPDASGLGVKKVREVMHNIVTGRARHLPRTVAATRTGWHGRDGERCYVWPDGRTFPDGRQIRLIGMRPELAEAARPRGESTDAEIREALESIVAHGRHGGTLGLGAGARSFGQSIRPVPAGLAPWGDPASGKSSLGWHARSLAVTSKGGRSPGWPPLPTKSFSATKTVLELAANTEADLPTLFEDLALPADAAAVEVRDANGKIEALIRSVANADEIRGRATRDLIAAPANYVRSIPLLTAERMPPVMMASLYRRAVVPRLYPGQIDTAWYGAHSAELLTPLRTIGARVVQLLYDLGDDAAGQLDKYTAAALGELSSAIGDAAWVQDVPAMSGVIEASAAILGGLYLIAEVVPGIDPAALTAPAITYLTGALEEQSSVIADRGTHTGSLADAVGQVLTRALSARRAHVCDRDGRPVPLVPGLTPSEQGLRGAGGHLTPEYEGQGVPLYWLADRGAVGVRSAALHGLLTEYRDPRTAGMTPRSLPDALLRDGASLPNTTQSGRTAVHRIRVGTNDESTRLILLRCELLTGDDESPRVVAISTGTTGTTGTPLVSGLIDTPSAPDAQKNGNNAGQRQDGATEEPAPGDANKPLTSDVPLVPVVPAGTGTATATPGHAPPVDRFVNRSARTSNFNGDNGDNGDSAGQGRENGRPERNEPKNGDSAGHGHDGAVLPSVPGDLDKALTSAVAVVPAETATATPGHVAAADRFVAHALVADVDGGYLARADRLEVVPLPTPLRDLADVVGWARTMRLGIERPSGRHDDAVVVVLPELAARLGLPADPPEPGTKAAQDHAALQSLRGSGWNVPELRSGMRVWRQGGRTIRLWLPGWDEYGKCPMWGEGGTAAATLAYRLGLFAEHVGIGWWLTGGATGVDLAGTFPRRSLRLVAAEPPKPARNAAVEPDYTWSRRVMPDEGRAAWVHCYDANAMYLPAYGQVRVNLGGWRHTDAPAFDPKEPGYWLVDPAGVWNDQLLPDPLDPLGRAAAGVPLGPRWYATETLAVLGELGYDVRPREALLPAEGAGRGRWYEPLYERLRDARAALAALPDADAAAVLGAVKAVWHETHGMFCVASQREQYRPDHRHAIIANARATLLRRLAGIADAEHRWPLAIATDNVAFASDDPDPASACPAGLKLGTGLGEFKVAGTLPMADAVPLLGTGRLGDVAKLFDLAKLHLDDHEGKE